MRVEFYKPHSHAFAQTWLVVIGNDVYEMDERALMPNGVNLYSGERSEFGAFDRHVSVASDERIPYQVVVAAMRRVADCTPVGDFEACISAGIELADQLQTDRSDDLADVFHDWAVRAADYLPD